jgi:hypothetical protein
VFVYQQIHVMRLLNKITYKNMPISLAIFVCLSVRMKQLEGRCNDFHYVLRYDALNVSSRFYFVSNLETSAEGNLLSIYIPGDSNVTGTICV